MQCRCGEQNALGRRTASVYYHELYSCKNCMVLMAATNTLQTLCELVITVACGKACNILRIIAHYGPLSRYEKLRVAHAPGMAGTFSPPPLFSDPDMHHGTCVTHVPWCMPGSLTSGFLWSQWREKLFGHPRRRRNPRFCVPGKRPMAQDPLSFSRTSWFISTTGSYPVSTVTPNL